MKWMPTLPEIGREAVIVVAGALVAAVVIRAMPQAWRDYLTFK